LQVGRYPGPIITYVTFGDDLLRGTVWAWRGVEFPVSPLSCIVALTTALALPCECVIKRNTQDYKTKAGH